MNLISARQLRRFLKETFLVGAAISITIYTWVRLLFFEAPLSFGEDAINLVKIVLSAWLMIILVKSCFYALLIIGAHLQRNSWSHRLRLGWTGPLLLMILIGTLLVVYTL